MSELTLVIHKHSMSKAEKRLIENIKKQIGKGKQPKIDLYGATYFVTGLSYEPNMHTSFLQRRLVGIAEHGKYTIYADRAIGVSGVMAEAQADLQKAAEEIINEFSPKERVKVLDVHEPYYSRAVLELTDLIDSGAIKVDNNASLARYISSFVKQELENQKKLLKSEAPEINITTDSIGDVSHTEITIKGNVTIKGGLK